MNPIPAAAAPKDAYPHAKIVFTLGPATQEEAMLEHLIHAGINVCRLNLAHADHAWTRTMIPRVRAVCERAGRHTAILMDVKGPEIRTGDVSAPVDLLVGQLIDLLPQPGAAAVELGVFAVTVNYPGLGHERDRRCERCGHGRARRPWHRGADGGSAPDSEAGDRNVYPSATACDRRDRPA